MASFFVFCSPLPSSILAIPYCHPYHLASLALRNSKRRLHLGLKAAHSLMIAELVCMCAASILLSDGVQHAAKLTRREQEICRIWTRSPQHLDDLRHFSVVSRGRLPEADFASNLVQRRRIDFEGIWMDFPKILMAPSPCMQPTNCAYTITIQVSSPPVQSLT